MDLAVANPTLVPVEALVRTITAPIHYPPPGSPHVDTSRTVSGCTDWNQKKRVLFCEVDLAAGFKVVAYAPVERPSEIFVDAYGAGPNNTKSGQYWRAEWGAIMEEVEPFIEVEVLGAPYTKTVQIPNVEHLNWSRHNGYGYGYNSRGANPHPATIDGLAAQNGGSEYDHQLGKYVQKPDYIYQHLMIRVTLLDGTGSKDIEFRFARPLQGRVNFNKTTSRPLKSLSIWQDFYGVRIEWEASAFLFQEFRSILDNLGSDATQAEKDALWAWWFQVRGFDRDHANRDLLGIKKIETSKTMVPVLERLAVEQPLLWSFFCWMHEGKLREKTSNNKLLTAMLERIGADYDALVTELRRVMDLVPTTNVAHEYGSERHDKKHSLVRETCLLLAGATKKVAEGKAKAQWQFAKGVRAKALVLGIDPVKHPLLLAAVESGKFSLALFHEAGLEDKLINVEFNILERALARKGWAPIIYKIAADAAQRKTYTKRITSYLSFLFRIETYLNRTAPRVDMAAVAKAKLQKKSAPKAETWRAMPKYVETQAALEMTEQTEEGTTKTRSAMTPVVDNDAGTITVPYLAMRVSGVVNTWMYSDQYFVAEEGAEDPLFTAGGVFENDFESKLNGRDDYGLMYFTLAGTDRNTGYPTFLIIFERTTAHGTRVHFHRVHPSRKRGPNGTETPPCRMVEEAYRYMAGNIRAEEINHQQGDLLLVRVESAGKGEDPVSVRAFENHSFVPLDPACGSVKFVKALGKSRGNLLGWLHASSGMRMPHPEHEPVENIEAGWYELRRCKSWEANPTSVMVLNID